MKNRKRRKFLVLVLILILFNELAVTVSAAPVIEIRPVGTVLTSPGAVQDYDICVVNGDSAWDMTMYAFSLWIDPNELEYTGFEYRNPVEWTEHMAFDGARNDEDTGDQTWFGSFNANNPDYSSYALEPYEELLITTLRATVKTPVLDGSWDVELKYYLSMGESFFDGNGFIQLAQTGGPDIAPIPEPSSMFLLSSGVIGLAGIGYRRRKSE